MSVNEKRTFSDSREGSPSTSDPVAKKICRENNSTENSSDLQVENDNGSNESTILDVLNEHCWIAVFQYVDIQDLINTEYASKQWHRIVHRYLQGIRVSLRHKNYKYEYVNWWFEHPMKSRVVYVPSYDLEDIVKKLGRSVVATFCTYPGEVDTIAEYCPDIEDLKIIPLQQKLDFREHRTAELKKLKRVHFHSPIYFRDEDIRCLIASPVLEELLVNNNFKITGRCLKSLTSQLKYLRLAGCKKLNVGNLVSSRHLNDLIKLDLNGNCTATVKNVYKLIEKTPKLECLTLEVFTAVTSLNKFQFRDEDIRCLIASPVLEELLVNNNFKITGRCLKSLTSQLKYLRLAGCKKLNVGNLVSSRHLNDLIKLDLNGNCTATVKNVYKLIEKTPKLECLTLEAYEYPTDVGGLVNAICRLSRLTHLSFLENINVHDDWLEAIGRCCKALRCVNVGKCKNVTAAGVLALCHGAGNTLIRLDVSSNDYITNEDVASIIHACPKLERLDVAFGDCLTPALAAVAEATLAATAPRPRLQLRLAYTDGYTRQKLMENAADLRLWSWIDEEPNVWNHHYLETIQDTRANQSNYEMLHLESSRGLEGYMSDVDQKLKAMTKKRIKQHTRASYTI